MNLAPYGAAAPAGDRAQRRASGAFYTPQPVVDYVVRQVLRPFLDGESLEGLAILDPACGAGSFLLGAERVLATWYRARGFDEKLASSHLFGVDVDPRAVAVAKRALPGARFAVGDALVDRGQRFSRGARGIDFSRAFPTVAKFDAVLGNPPFLRVRALRVLHPERIEWLRARYRTAVRSWDLSPLFVERALELVRAGGRVGFVLPIQLLHQPNGERLRELLLDENSLETVADLSRLRAFSGATVKTCAIVCRREKSGARQMIATLAPSEVADLDGRHAPWPQRKARENPGRSLKLDLLSSKRALCEKLRMRSISLEALCYVTFGLRSCAPGRGRGGKERLVTDDASAPDAVPYLEGCDVARYMVTPSGRHLRYLPSEMYSARTPALFTSQKIVSRALLSKPAPQAALDENGYFCEQTLVCILPHGIVTPARAAGPSLWAILAAINGAPARFHFASWIIDASFGGGLTHAAPGAQRQLLIPRSDGKWLRELALLAARAQDGERACEATIDQLLCEFYRLTRDEIDLVEGRR
jgi:SAM-dependent methyltransferase